MLITKLLLLLLVIFPIGLSVPKHVYVLINISKPYICHKMDILMHEYSGDS